MSPELLSKCHLYIANTNIIHEQFRMAGTYAALAGSCVYTAHDLHADGAQLKEASRILKSNTGIFSSFRGISRVPLICSMVLSGHPEQFFHSVEQVYDMFRTGTTLSYEHRVLAALSVALCCNSPYIPSVVAKTYALFDTIKNLHPMLTSAEDLPLISLIAMSNMSPEDAMADMEDCYRILAPQFFSKNALQSLSHALALSPQPTELKCERVMEIFNKLKNKGHRYTEGIELAGLAPLAMLDCDVDLIVSELIEADDLLRQEKGFRLSVDNSLRRQIAACLVLFDLRPYVMDPDVPDTLSTMTLLTALQLNFIARAAAAAAAST